MGEPKLTEEATTVLLQLEELTEDEGAEVCAAWIAKTSRNWTLIGERADELADDESDDE